MSTKSIKLTLVATYLSVSESRSLSLPFVSSCRSLTLSFMSGVTDTIVHNDFYMFKCEKPVNKL